MAALPALQGEPTIRRILREAGKVRHPSGTVFLGDTGQPVTLEGSKSRMRRVWKKVLQDRPRPWKTLRATFATRQVEWGTAVPVIAELMGLTTAHVFEHYVKPSGVHLEDAMATNEGSHATDRRGAADTSD